MEEARQGAIVSGRSQKFARKGARSLIVTALALGMCGMSAVPALATVDAPVTIEDGGSKTTAFTDLLTSRLSDERQEAYAARAHAPATAWRIAGSDRYATGVAVSQAGFELGAPVVYVATGAGFADALSAAPAAAHAGGPLLLVQPGGIPQVVRDEIVRLQPSLIVVVGGNGAVSDGVFGELTKLAPSVRRDSGADRYETSRVVTERAFGGGADVEVAYIATGSDFPDALSAGAVAGAYDVPVVLVPGLGTSVDKPTEALFENLGVYMTGIAGGEGAVSKGVENHLGALLGPENVVRFSGADRYATSVALNEGVFEWATGGFLATGTGFADALSGAALAGYLPLPLWVVPNTCVFQSVVTQGTQLGVTDYYLLGGPGALGAGVEELYICGS
jgi:putative cell wall-binding protein